MCYNKFIKPIALFLIVLFFQVFIFEVPLHAETISRTIGYQGYLEESDSPVDGSVDMTFALYGSSSGGSALWTESRTGGNQVSVTSGYFSVSLGSVTSIPTSIDFSQKYYLQITIDGTTLSPRQTLDTVPYAHVALAVRASTTAPTSPTEGALYFDPTGNGTLYVYDSSAGWISVNATSSSATSTLDDAYNAFGANASKVTVDAGEGQTGGLEFETSGSNNLVFDIGGTGGILFQDGGSTFASFVDGGRLGIGTTSPEAKLEIVSDSSANIFLTNSSGSSLKLAGEGSASAVGTQNSSPLDIITDNFSRIRITSSGNVGIATSSPTHKLSVAGDINFTGALRTNGSAGTSGYVLQSTGSGAPQWVATSSLGISAGGSGTVNSGTEGYVAYYGADGTAVSATNTLFIASDGKVGIGTTTPDSKLVIVGGISSTNGNGDKGEQFGLSASAGPSSVAVGYNTNGGGTTGSVVIGASSAVSGNYAVAIGNGASSASRGISIGRNATASSYGIALGYESTAGVNEFVAGDSQQYIGNVYFGEGVVDATPLGYTIHSTGGSGTNISGSSLTLAGGKGTGNASGGDIVFQTSDAGASGTTLQSLSTKLILTNAGYLGIGTTSPTHKLSVAGDINFTGALRTNGSAGTSGYVLQSTGSGAPQWVATSSLGISAGGSGTVNSGTEGYIAYYGADGTALSGTSTIFIDGEKVGIGTTSPQYTLSVDGRSQMIYDDGVASGIHHIAEFLRYKSSPSNAGMSIGYYANGSSVDYSYLYAPGGQDFAIATYDSAFSPKLYLKNTGEFGIGTTTPDYPLTVDGNVGIAGGGYLQFDNLGLNLDNVNIIRIAESTTLDEFELEGDFGGGGSTGNAIKWRSTWTDDMLYLRGDGNIGISTSSPAYKLSVAGDINFTGALRTNGSAGTSGYVLQSTGSGAPQWVATSSLGISAGGSGTVNSGTSGYFAYYPSTGTTVDDQSVLYTDGTNIGIGTTNPDRALHIRSSYVQIPFESSGLTGSIPFTDTSTIGLGASAEYIGAFTQYSSANGGFVFQGFSNTNSASGFGIQGHVGGTSPTVPAVIVEGWKSNGSTGRTAMASTESILRVRAGTGSSLFEVRADGTVGIGDATPDYTFEVEKSQSASTYIAANNPSSAGLGGFAAVSDLGAVVVQSLGSAISSPSTWQGWGRVRTDSGLNGLYVGTGGSDPLAFVVNDSEVGRFSTAGYLGIGTTSPTAKLSIKGSGTGTGKALLITDSSNVNRLTVLDNGKVGIGTISPTHTLSVAGAISLNDELQLDAGEYIYWGSANGFIEAGSVSDTLNIGTAFDQVAITVDASQRVGIGTTSPTHKLSVAGDLNFTGALRTNGSAGTSGYVLQSTGSGAPQWVATSSLGISGGGGGVSIGDAVGSATAGSILFVDGSTQLAQDNDAFYFDSTNNYLKLGTSTDPVVIGDITGNTRGTYAVDIQSARPNGVTRVAGGTQSIAIGYNNAADAYSTIIGQSQANTGTKAIAIGYSNTILSSEGTVIGVVSSIGGSAGRSIAAGYDSDVNSAFSVGMGYNADVGAGGSNMVSMGNNTSVTGSGGVAVGRAVSSSASNAVSLGYNNTASASGAVAIGVSVTNSTASSLQIGPSDSAKMTILSTGNTGIGTTTPARKLHVYRSDDGAPVRFEDANGYCEIDPTSTTWTCSSDRRLKKNIKAMDNSDNFDRILALEPSTFSWLKDKNGEIRSGFIAQDVEDIFPDLVRTDEKGYKSVAYGGFIPYIISALQELAARVEELAQSTIGAVVESLTVGSSNRPTGITLFDEVTGEPYCLSIRNGESVTTAGECGTTPVPSATPQTGNGSGGGVTPTPTPEPTPEPEETPEEVPGEGIPEESPEVEETLEEVEESTPETDPAPEESPSEEPAEEESVEEPTEVEEAPEEVEESTPEPEPTPEPTPESSSEESPE